MLEVCILNPPQNYASTLPLSYNERSKLIFSNSLHKCEGTDYITAIV